MLKIKTQTNMNNTTCVIFTSSAEVVKKTAKLKLRNSTVNNLKKWSHIETNKRTCIIFTSAVQAITIM